MSRLAEILMEDMSGAVLTGNQFKKYTAAGNLFRLMLVTNPDQSVPTTSDRSLVKKMLTGQNENIVKKLQTSFNAINKLLRAGKNPKSVDKKNYFISLFQLLLPMTKADGLIKRSKTLASTFAGGGPKSLPAKRKTIIIIGRALIGNKEIKLNSKDKALINGFIMGFEAVVDQAENGEPVDIGVPEEIRPETTDVVQQKLETQSTPEVKKAEETTQKVIDGVKAKQPKKSEAIKEMMATNTTADVFKVDLQGDNAAINDQVNEKIQQLYNQWTTEHGH